MVTVISRDDDGFCGGEVEMMRRVDAHSNAYAAPAATFSCLPEQDEGVRRHRDGAPLVPGGAAHGRVRRVLAAEPAAPGVVQLGAQLSRGLRVHVRVRHDDASALHQLQGKHASAAIDRSSVRS